MRTCALLSVFIAALALSTSPAAAEPFDTKHRICFGPGYHSFFPEDDEQEGTKPDQNGVVTEDEWRYIYDEGYDISDYNGGTFEVGYEYNFYRWFGLAAAIGWYGGQDNFDFYVEGLDVQTDTAVSVFHIDVSPRFHWQTRWTDLYGGPVLGIYSAKVNWKTEVSATFNNQEFNFEDSDTESDSALGWGLNFGFELRISEHWGVALEDRVTSAVVFPDADTEEPFNAGGNVLLLMAVAHL